MLILDDAAQARLRICTAESCTGGLLAGLLSALSEASSARSLSSTSPSKQCPRRWFVILS